METLCGVHSTKTEAHRKSTVVGSKPELCYLPYQQHLQELHLPSLYYQHLWGDMIAVYQVLHGRLDLGPQVFFNTAIARDTR